jgi:type I restriction enzyme S subunit
MSNGMKQTEIGEIPMEWELVELQQILVEARLGGNYQNGEAEEGLPLIKMGNLGRGKMMLNKIERIPKDFDYTNDDILNKDDLLLNTRNTLDLVGKVAIWRNELDIALYNSNLLKLIFSSEKVANNHFMNYVFNSEFGIQQLRSFATGTTSVAAIYTKDLKKFKIILPPLPEQQKIAEILSTVDEKIAVIDEQLAKTNELKTGLMQRLLTKGIGHTEFKDSPLGEIPKEWKVVQLADVLRLVERPIKMNDDDSYELVTVKRRFGGITPRGAYLGKDVKVKSQFIVRENDFLISKRQIVHCACGLVPADLDGAIVSNEYSVFNSSSDLNLSFFEYYVQRPDMQKSFLLCSDGVHIEKMLFKVRDWIKTLVLIPPVAEQHKIAEILTTVDEKTQVLHDKKAHYQTLKRGLMQQLLTGKLRVRVAQDAVAA